MNMNYVKQDSIKRFTDQCFDRDSEKAAGIVKGIPDSRSPRISDVSHTMKGSSSDSNYRSIHRFPGRNDTKEALQRLYDDESPYVIGDPTEIQRPQAKNTEYVGKLQGDVRGYWILLLATPHRGRAIPFSFVTYSSSTINSECSSRNMKHIKSISEVKELIGDKVLILDREFSYEGFLSELVEAGISFVICLNKKNGVRITDQEGNRLSLLVDIGEEGGQSGVYYKGNIEVNPAYKWPSIKF